MMQTCKNCGNFNSSESKFCRFCGTRSQSLQVSTERSYPEAQTFPEPDPSRNPPPPADNFSFGPPQPYSWKTDEFRTNNTARETVSLPPAAFAETPFAGPPAHVGAFQGAMTTNYRCPYCATTFLPRIERKISTAGWITFALLLAFVFPLFWIGLLIKEDQHFCPLCRRRVS